MKLNQLIATYIGIRDKKEALVKKQKEDVAKYTEALKKIEGVLLKHFQTVGQTSAKSDEGIAFIKVANTDKIADRETFLEYVKENDLFDLLENRINSSALNQFIEDHNDLPPGVTRNSVQIIQVRRN